jgi:hypothetical protein
MRAKTVAKAKIGESNPSLIPTPVASEVTKALWELGIPPGSTNRLKFSSLETKAQEMILKNCAIAQARIAIIRISLLRICPRIGRG